MITRLLWSAISGLVILVAPSTSSGQVRPTPTAPTSPPRDVRTSPQNGTGVIRGRVVAGDTGRPLRRVQITVSSPELGRDNRTSNTDADGRYEVKELPAGRYTITVRRGDISRSDTVNDGHSSKASHLRLATDRLSNMSISHCRRRV